MTFFWTQKTVSKITSGKDLPVLHFCEKLESAYKPTSFEGFGYIHFLRCPPLKLK